MADIEDPSIELAASASNVMADSENPPIEPAVNEPSIFRVPACYRKVKEDAYDPVVVAFGPYHNPRHGDGPLLDMLGTVPKEDKRRYDLLRMEIYKEKVLQLVLNKAGKNDDSDLVAAVEAEASDLKKCYDRLEEETRWSEDKEFARLMVRDGLFMIALLDVWSRTTEAPAVEGVGLMEDGLSFAPNDPVFGEKARRYLWDHIRDDMLRLENQIPLKVLQILLQVPFCWQQSSCRIQELHSHIIQFLDEQAVYKNGYPRGVQGSLAYHVLDLFKRNHILGPDERPTRQQELPYLRGAAAATLYLVGVVGIMPTKPHSRCFDDVYVKEICRKKVLCLPMVIFNDFTAVVLLNLMSLERLHHGTGDEVTKLMEYVSTLIKSPLDCQTLRAVYHVHVGGSWTTDEITDFCRKLAQAFPPAPHDRKRPRLLPRSLGLVRIFTYPAWFLRWLQLLRIEDRGRQFPYYGFIAAIIGIYLTLIFNFVNLFHGGRR